MSTISYWPYHIFLHIYTHLLFTSPLLRTPYLFCFILISWGCLTSPTLFCNLIGPLQKKVEIMEAPQNRRFYGKMECHLLWPTYIGEKGRTLGKMYGIKARCYWEHLGEHIGNLMGTHWELEENMLGTKEK